ncbi:SDR family oxidoreductase [Variovorax sp. RA8]|jgi:3-oxoacyl-[acyl-carrier protein] reductase|uniref:SDR family oxidoreductase n=1 Tax=Variovorax sp. (strain JCM 16519 / RA8) TaxID=662548 RepID=UPI001317E29A|nr:SDR family NAD(P)-dependent oxidoreductase [Variovorax sp. RA8]VTU27359.1 3-oxoacyl-[acyl-carrier-protein] reductase FabG [Variovorax sp. RA8]
MEQKEQRVAAVTGAAGGLGLGIAQRLARAGYQVIAIDRARQVEEAAAALQGQGLSAQAVVLDIADEAAVKKMVADVDAQYGRFDILVNNAGIHPKIDGERNSFLKMTTAQWNEVLGVNLTAAFVLCREVAPLMRTRKWGRIVNMSSRAGRTLVETAGIHYAAAKAGMIGMTRIIASEVAADGITANCIAPGRIESPMTSQGSEAQRAMLVGRIPVGRIGTPDEIGHVVEFLVSEDSGYLTGTVIDVNGGTFMC